MWRFEVKVCLKLGDRMEGYSSGTKIRVQKAGQKMRPHNLSDSRLSDGAGKN